MTNPNGMNQSFLDKQNYNLWRKRIPKKIQIFANFFVALSPLL